MLLALLKSLPPSSGKPAHGHDGVPGSATEEQGGARGGRQERQGAPRRSQEPQKQGPKRELEGAKIDAKIHPKKGEKAAHGAQDFRPHGPSRSRGK